MINRNNDFHLGYAKHPFNDRVIDQWLPLSEADKATHPKFANIPEINLMWIKEGQETSDKHEGKLRDQFNAIRAKLPALENKNLYFHGTRHDSLKNFGTNGIILEENLRKTDFTKIGCGFYLSRDYGKAATYGHRKANDGAVLVFAFDKDEDEAWHSNYKGVVFGNDDSIGNFRSDQHKEAWEATIRYHRYLKPRFDSHYLNKDLEDFKKLMEDTPFIEGPMLHNPIEVTNKEGLEEWANEPLIGWEDSQSYQNRYKKGTDKEKVYTKSVQICLRNEKLCSEFFKKLCAIVLYEQQ